MREIRKVGMVIGEVPRVFNQEAVFYLAKLGNIQKDVSDDLRYNLGITEQQINDLVVQNNLQDYIKELVEANYIGEVPKLTGTIKVLGNSKAIVYIGRQANYQSLIINKMHQVIKNQIITLKQLQDMLGIQDENITYKQMSDVVGLTGTARLLFNREDIEVVRRMKNYQSTALNTINTNIMMLANQLTHIQEKNKTR